MSSPTFTYPTFVPKPAITSGNGYKCPSCGLELSIIEGTTTYSCDNNHSFDRAKEGYINLHLAQHKRSRNPGDSDDMIRSRQRFLNAGYYQDLAKAIIAHLGEQDGEQLVDKRLLDIGCGEGYYLSEIRKVHSELQLVGIDISKTAVRLAAKRKLDAQLAVDSAFNISLFDNSIDTAISVFSPINTPETSRVLKPGGTLIMVGPGEQHLSGLTAHIYDKTQPHKGNYASLDDSPEFTLKEQIEVSETICVKGTAIADLLRMTPYYWHCTPEQQAQLGTLEQLETPIHFTIRLYQNCAEALEILEAPDTLETPEMLEAPEILATAETPEAPKE